MTEEIKRKNIRFSPDENTVVWFSKGKSDFKKDFIGLAVSEAHGGAAFVMTKEVTLEKHDPIVIKVGELSELKAEVRWVKKLDEDVYKIGIQYLE